jgi:hypothetical protein
MEDDSPLVRTRAQECPDGPAPESVPERCSRWRREQRLRAARPEGNTAGMLHGIACYQMHLSKIPGDD